MASTLPPCACACADPSRIFHLENVSIPATRGALEAAVIAAKS
jgi:hypothetical protein